MKKDVHKVITNKMLKLLNEGTVPWHKPWRSPDEYPRNLVSGKRYRGVNACIGAQAQKASDFILEAKYNQTSDESWTLRSFSKNSSR